jgi:hypothetical protein
MRRNNDEFQGWLLEPTGSAGHDLWLLTNETGDDAQIVHVGLDNDAPFHIAALVEDLDDTTFVCKPSTGQRLRIGWASKTVKRTVVHIPFPASDPARVELSLRN